MTNLEEALSPWILEDKDAIRRKAEQTRKERGL